jgi:hypothetical protein
MTEDDATEYRRLEEMATERGKAGDHHGMMELFHQASNLGGYAPFMAIWTPEGERLVDAWQYIVRDHREFQRISEVVSTALFPARPS